MRFYSLRLSGTAAALLAACAIPRPLGDPPLHPAGPGGVELPAAAACAPVIVSTPRPPGPTAYVPPDSTRPVPDSTVQRRIVCPLVRTPDH